MGFHQKLYVILRRYLFSENLFNKYISKTQPHSGVELQETTKFYFKIPSDGHFTVKEQPEKYTQTC